MYIKVRVSVKAKNEKVVRTKPDHFNIWVKEKAERNLANRRIVELIAEEFKIVKGKVRIINGHQSPSKIIDVDVE